MFVYHNGIIILYSIGFFVIKKFHHRMHRLIIYGIRRFLLKGWDRMGKWVHFTFKFTLLFLISIIAASCTVNSGQPTATPTVEGAVEVERTFREFYANLGGMDILGPAITGTIEYKNLICQYTENALMCFDTIATDMDRFFLYGLARTFEIEQIDGELPVQNDQGRIINNITIYEEFLPLYDQLFGARYVGKPLTTVRYNPYKQRIEQYFENVGFYRLLTDSPGEVHLLSYGAYVCDAHCRFKPDPPSIINNFLDNITVPFMPYIIRMGDPTAFGEPITLPFTYQGDQRQQVFENVVFVGNPENAASVHLLNLPELLGLPRDVPGPQVYTEKDNVIFRPVDGLNGFHVPLDFDYFIINNGGYTFSGNPISMVYTVEKDKLFRQCFQNYCLDYDLNKPAGENVSMTPLGDLYLEYANLDENLVVKFKFSTESILFNISAVRPQLPADEEQKIDILVLRSRDQLPMENIEAYLLLTMPDGTVEKYNFQPTNAEGASQFTIPPHPEFSNGYLIPFKVCLNVPSDEPICQEDNYMIWDHQ